MFSELSKVSQGCVGLGHAIAHFVAKGQTVSLPLIDNQDYDLIVDEGGILKRVQVKTSGTKGKSGHYEVQLKSVRPNRTGNTIKRFDPLTVDYLFVLLCNGDRYVLPCSEVNSGCSITLNKSRSIYKI